MEAMLNNIQTIIQNNHVLALLAVLSAVLYRLPAPVCSRPSADHRYVGGYSGEIGKRPRSTRSCSFWGSRSPSRSLVLRHRPWAIPVLRRSVAVYWSRRDRRGHGASAHGPHFDPDPFSEIAPREDPWSLGAFLLGLLTAPSRLPAPRRC